MPPAATESESVVRLTGVTKNYGQRVVTEVLRGIDLTLEHGEFTALIGPSGSGKSTLLNLIGLLDRPTAGQVWIGDRDTSRLDEDESTRLRARAIGFVFQFHHLLPAFTALENVFLPAMADRGRTGEDLRDRARMLLGRVGLENRIAYKPGELSGGQQQRVAVARALMMNPRLVLADEPTGNLDTQSTDQIFSLLREINQSERTAFLIVTHDSRLAARCDRKVELIDGRIVSDTRNSPSA